MGSQHLLGLFVSSRVPTCVCFGPSVLLSLPDFVRLFVAGVRGNTHRRSRVARGNARFVCLAFVCTIRILVGVKNLMRA